MEQCSWLAYRSLAPIQPAHPRIYVLKNAPEKSYLEAYWVSTFGLIAGGGGQLEKKNSWGNWYIQKVLATCLFSNQNTPIKSANCGSPGE